MSTIDPRELRNACGQFGTGVTIITTHCEGRDHGMTANAFMSVSLDPPLVAISIAKSAKMLRNIQSTGRFAVSVLAEGMEDLAWHFAGKPKLDLRDVFERRDHVVGDGVLVDVQHGRFLLFLQFDQACIPVFGNFGWSIHQTNS